MTGLARTPTAGEYRARARPAGLFTEWINYPVAARLCTVAYRFRLRPTVLTVANLLLGIGASVAVVLLGPTIAGDPRRAAVVGVLAWCAWQLAYCADCSDGQLARVTSTASAAGGRLDVLCDIAVQVSLVAAVAAVASAAGGVPAWLVAVFAGSWMVNLVTSVMAKEGTNVSLMSSASLMVRLVKLARDYSAMVTLIGATIAVRPAAMVWVMALFCVVNGGFLLASIAQAGRASWRGAAA
jgi:phosphatidylglycerophosphate synthase